MGDVPFIFSSSWVMRDGPWVTTYSAGSGFPSNRLLQDADRNKKLQAILPFTNPFPRWLSSAGDDSDLFVPPLLDA